MNRRSFAVLGIGWMLGVGVATPALAVLEINPYLSAGVMHDDNVLRLADAAEAEELRGDSRRGDTVTTYTVGVGADYSRGQQKLVLGAAANRTEYDRFRELDYEGHDLSGKLDWSIGSGISGDLSVLDSRAQESFSSRDRDLDARGFRDTTKWAGQARMRVLTQYEIRPGLETRRVRHTLPSSLQQDLDEDTVRLGLRYVGSGAGDIGIEVQRDDGGYRRRIAGEGIVESYEQVTLQFVGRWTPSPITTLSFGIGSSRRDNEGIDTRDTSGLVGNLGISRQLSVKTSIHTGLHRTLSSSELQGESTVVSTGWNLGTLWTPVDRVRVAVDYLLQRDRFEDSQTLDGVADDREDDYQSLRLSVDYSLFPWMVVKPYYRWEDRDSPLPRERYDAYQVGLELKLQLPRSAQRAAP